MNSEAYDGESAQWMLENCVATPEPIEKASQQTAACFAKIGDQAVFVKLYPPAQSVTWAAVEAAISGAGLHPAIVPLRRRVECVDGVLLIFDRVDGENLGPSENRSKFQRLSLTQRIEAVLTVAEALASICDAGYMVVDWYFGNMIYDFSASRIWLFDWELCREDGAFILEMDSNYGSSALMAPEEFIRGSLLDQATLVFNIGRFALIGVPELAERIAPVLAKATYPRRAKRYGSAREFVAAFRAAVAALREF